MGKYDDQSEERPPSNAANPVGSSGSSGMAAADGRADDCFSQGGTSSFVLSCCFLSSSSLDAVVRVVLMVCVFLDVYIVYHRCISHWRITV